MNSTLYLRGTDVSDRFCGSGLLSFLQRYKYSDPGIIAAVERLGELDIEVTKSVIPWRDYQNAANCYVHLFGAIEDEEPSVMEFQEQFEEALANIPEDKRDLMRKFCEEGLGGVEKKFYQYYIKPPKDDKDEIPEMKLTNEECVGRLEKKTKRIHPSPYLTVAKRGDEVVVKCIDYHTEPCPAFWYYFHLAFEVIVNGTDHYRFSRVQKKSDDETVSVPEMFIRLVNDLENDFVSDNGGHPCMYSVEKLQDGKWVCI